MQRVYGDKYDDKLDGPGLAKAIRRDIKQAVRAGTLPNGIYSVRFSWATHSYAIDVRVKHLEGIAVLNPQHERYNQGGTPRNDWPPDAREWLSPQGKEIKDTLESIMGAYNHDGSEIETDYFDVNFYGHAEFDWKFTKAERKRILAGEPANATEPYEPEKRATPKAKPQTSDFTEAPILEALESIEVYGRPYTVERIDETAQKHNPTAYMLTSKRGAKIALKREARYGNLYAVNADYSKASSPLKGEWFHDSTGTLTIGYLRIKAVSA